MNKELKEKWVVALRSCYYEQGEGQLRDKYNNFCCLGVLCDIHPEVNWYSFENGYSAYYKNKKDSYSLPFNLEKDSGLTLSIQDELARMNDNGKTFEEIANYIDAEL